MDLAALTSTTAFIGYGLFLIVCFCCYRLMRGKNYLILIAWPILIYFLGPTFTALFADAPVLRRYVFPETILAETLMIFAYFVALLVADRIFDISSIIKISTTSSTIRRLSEGPAFLALFCTVTAIALVLQIRLLAEYGSLLSGSYLLDNVAEGLIPYWGFLAGLYEIIFLLFVVFLLGDRHALKHQVVVVGLYLITAALRVAGGTRLVLVKEIAFLLILFYLRGSVTKKRLGVIALVVLVAGSAVGTLRSQNQTAAAILGPLFGIVMEGGLNALTLNIAYRVQDGGFVSANADTLHTILFVAISAIPSFARFGMQQSDLDVLSPYMTLPVNFGFDTAWPVGSMSGFGTLCYICSYPILASVILAFTIGLLFRYTPAGSMKRIIVIVFAVNAIHFWRDPIDIAVKLLVQGVACGIVLLCLSRVSAHIMRRPPALSSAGP
jgi:hypothetical protein